MAETTPNEAIQEADAARPPAALTAPPALPAPPSRAYETDQHYAPAPSRRQSPPQARIPFLASVFSLFPGLGNVYNGLYLRGITFFAICFGLIALAAGSRVEERVLLIFTVLFVWLFNIFDAYRQATLINYGYSPDDELPVKPRVSAWGSGGLVAGVVVFAIGFYGFLREYLHIDLSLLVDHWYLLFMAFGVFLMWRPLASWFAKFRNQVGAEPGDTPDDLEGI